MTVYAITDTKKGEQGLRLLIFILPYMCCACVKYVTYICIYIKGIQSIQAAVI